MSFGIRRQFLSVFRPLQWPCSLVGHRFSGGTGAHPPIHLVGMHSARFSGLAGSRLEPSPLTHANYEQISGPQLRLAVSANVMMLKITGEWGPGLAPGFVEGTRHTDREAAVGATRVTFTPPANQKPRTSPRLMLRGCHCPHRRRPPRLGAEARPPCAGIPSPPSRTSRGSTSRGSR